MNPTEYPVSVGQRLLWFMDHYRGDCGALNCPVLLRLRGQLDLARLQTALDLVVARHPMLRTTFSGKGRVLTQIIHPPRRVEIRRVDLEGASSSDSAVHAEIRSELQTRIDPERCPVRVTLWRVAEEEYVLCFNMHHLVTDGQSCGIIVRDLQHIYAGTTVGSTALPEIPCSYIEFVKRENEWLKSSDFRKHLDYWQQQLAAGKPPPLPVELAQPGAVRRTETYCLDLDASVLERLREAARARRTTTFSLMLAVYYAVLCRLTGQNDLSIGSIFLNRSGAEVQNTVGFFANLLVLRTRVPALARFSDLLRLTHATVMDAFMHQAVSHYLLPPQTMQTGPLRADEIVFQMMPQPLHGGKLGAMKFDALPVEGVGNRFEFELAVVMTKAKLSAVVSYNRARIQAEWARSFLSYYVDSVRLAARIPDAPLQSFDPGRFAS
jgi:hypothetical protein